MSTLLAAATSNGSRPLACVVFLVWLWAGVQPAPAAAWQEHRDAGFLAFANADYMASAEHLEKALAAAHEGPASAEERGVIFEKLTTSYLAARWFRRARTSISRWDSVLATSPGEPWAFQQWIDRDRLALLVSEVIGEAEPNAASTVSIPPYDAAAGETPEALAAARTFEAVVDVAFAPDVSLPVSGAVGYAIHLVSLAKQESVDGSWAELQESFPGILAEKDLQVRQVDLGDRGVFYRIHAAPFAASEKAEATCEELRSLQQYCAVVDLE